MLPPVFKMVIAGTICLLLSIFFGYSIAVEDYTHFVILALSIGLLTAFILPGYTPLIAFALLIPFSIPVPLLFGFPWIGLMLGICCLKYFFRGAVRKNEHIPWRPCINFTIATYFATVVLRYIIDPVTPGIAIGIGEGVTGFRGYFNYALCLFMLITLGLFIFNREQILKLLKWNVVFSVLMIMLLTPLIFTKSMTVASLLGDFGLFVTFFDNGWLRFVNLPLYGLILLVAALLPNIFPFPVRIRTTAFLVGMAAVVMGGNRGTFVGALLAILCILVLKRRWFQVTTGTIGITLLLFTLYLIGEQAPASGGVGILRVSTLVSGKAADVTDASQNIQWRMIRWERALQDIKDRPWIGYGFGGLDRAFVFSNVSDYQTAKVDIDVAAGTIHNGFLSTARALGVPAVLIFLFLISLQLLHHAKKALSFAASNPQLSELHMLVFAFLSAHMIFIYTAIDLNSFSLWFYIGLGMLISRVQPTKVEARTSVPSESIPRFIGARLSAST